MLIPYVPPPLPVPVRPGTPVGEPLERAVVEGDTRDGPAAPGRPRPKLIPRPCVNFQSTGPRVPATAVVAGGTATVRWAYDGDRSVRSFKVAAIPQPSTLRPLEEPPWRPVARPATCGEMTAVIPGLTAGRRYVIWVNAIVVSPVTKRTTDTTVAEAVVRP